MGFFQVQAILEKVPNQVLTQRVTSTSVLNYQQFIFFTFLLVSRKLNLLKSLQILSFLKT